MAGTRTKAEKFDGGSLFLYVVLGTIQALRRAEIARMEAARQLFAEDTARVLGQASIVFGDRPEECLLNVLGKSRKRRTIEIISGWVEIIRPYVEAGYPFIPQGFFGKWNTLRLLCGFKGAAVGIKQCHLAEAPDELVTYGVNLMRHSGLTNHLAAHGHEGETALFGGDSPKEIHRNYKGRTTKAKALEFFAFYKKLTVQSVARLRQKVPAGARPSELRQLDTPLEHHTTYFLPKEKFLTALDDRKRKLVARLGRKKAAEAAAVLKSRDNDRSLLHHVSDLKTLLKYASTSRIAELLNCSTRVLNHCIKNRGVRRPSKASLRHRGEQSDLPPEFWKVIEEAKKSRLTRRTADLEREIECMIRLSGNPRANWRTIL